MRVGALDTHVAARSRAQVAHRRGERRKLVQRVAELIQRQRLNVVLDVGGGVARIGLSESAELAGRHGQRAAPLQRVHERHLHFA